MTQPAWLSRAVFYQIYPQSFFDANGDGIGDLPGIEAKLDYLADLGINAIWINPCFVSPCKDAGYDVSDYKTVAARYGTNDDLAQLVAAAHERDIRVCLDLVAGHTSDEHPWFKESALPADNELSDRYIWTRNPWVTADGDLRFISGTTDRMGSFAINFFAHQPALNYGFEEQARSYQQAPDAPGPQATRAALKDIMAHWLDMGVDGFRVDMAGSLVKADPRQKGVRSLWREIRQWLDDNYEERVLIAEWGHPEVAVDAGFHIDFMLHFGAPGFDALFLGPDSFPARKSPCYFDEEGAGDFGRFWEAFAFQSQRIGERGFIALPSSNHDFQRPRAGRSVDDLKVIFTFLLTWKHVPFIYYGDEIGMRYLDGLPSKEGGYQRTGTRTPMQWGPGRLAGFSTSETATPYLSLDPQDDRPTVAAQRADKSSLWHLVEQLIYLRVTEPDLSPDVDVQLLTPESPGYPLVYRRGESLVVAINPSGQPSTVRLERTGDASPVLGAGCQLSHDSDGWLLKIRPRGYGVFNVA
jgi:maltose alpha-D-glucosyltransferase/alpha-amylase